MFSRRNTATIIRHFRGRYMTVVIQLKIKWWRHHEIGGWVVKYLPNISLSFSLSFSLHPLIKRNSSFYHLSNPTRDCYLKIRKLFLVHIKAQHHNFYWILKSCCRVTQCVTLIMRFLFCMDATLLHQTRVKCNFKTLSGWNVFFHSLYSGWAAIIPIINWPENLQWIHKTFIWPQWAKRT